MTGRNLLAAVALLMVATACNDDVVRPKLEAWVGAEPGELSGIGTIQVGTPDQTTFAFDVKSDASGVHGVFTASDVAGESLTTDPTVNPANSFTAFRASSGFCSVSSHGAEFDATGVLVESGVVVDPAVPYTVKACDNGSAVAGMDTWRIEIPSRTFSRDGIVTGDIVKQ